LYAHQAQVDRGSPNRLRALTPDEVLSDQQGGLPFDAKNLLLGQYMSLWLEDSVKDTVRLTTYQGYE
jgi:hypothetical protein